MLSPFAGMSCVTKQKNDITFCGDVMRYKADKRYHLLQGCHASQSRKMISPFAGMSCVTKQKNLSPFAGMSCVTKQKNDITFCGGCRALQSRKMI